MNTYTKDDVDTCRSTIDRQVGAYRDLLAAAGGRKEATGKLAGAIDTFETVFFNNMVLVLENRFVHRSRTIEGKDGNPMNEVRVLASSLAENGGVLKADKQIKLKAEASVLHLAPGDAIAVREDEFLRLADAFFEELGQKFV